MRLGKLRPTPGLLIGAIALVFAMTGAAVAAKDRIQTNDIAKKAVTGSRIANDAIKSGKIVDGKIKAKDLEAGVIPAAPAAAYGRVNKSGGNVAVGQRGGRDHWSGQRRRGRDLLRLRRRRRSPAARRSPPRPTRRARRCRC